MPFELYMLAAATLLALLAFLPDSVYKSQAYGGLRWLGSNRDVSDKDPLTGAGARAQRAYANFKDNYPPFVAAIVILVYTGHTGMSTAVASAIFVGARLLYIPVYIRGIPLLRTTLWGLAWASTIFILAVGVFG